MADTMLFKIDTIVADGKTLAFEDSTGVLEGAAGFEGEVKVSASGPDYISRKRVARTLKANLQWSSTSNPRDFVGMKDIQITMRDSVSGRKVIADGASFVGLGQIGAGAVEVTFGLLKELKWL